MNSEEHQEEYRGKGEGVVGPGNSYHSGGKKRAFLMLRVSDKKQATKYGPDAQRMEAYQGAKDCPIPLELSRGREAFWV